MGAWFAGRLRMEEEEVGNRKRNLTGHPRSFQNEPASYSLFSGSLADGFSFLSHLSKQTGYTSSDRASPLPAETHDALPDRGARTPQLCRLPDLF